MTYLSLIIMDQLPHSTSINESTAISPPVTYNYASLPWHEIPWDHFEHLCYRILCNLHGMENCSPYGTVGQNQHGIDHFVRIPGSDKYIVYQAKRNTSFTKGDLLKAIKKWEEGKWYSKTREFVIISSNHLCDTGFIDEFELQKSRLASLGITLKKTGSHELNILLREIPSIVDEFFKTEWAKRFCSVAAVARYFDGHVPLIGLEKKDYPAVQYYIPRKVTRPETVEEPFSSFSSRYTIQLPEYVNECIAKGIATRIIVKAEAASGKSKELEQLAYLYSINDHGIYPVLIRLKNFHGDLADYVNNFYAHWREIPPERLLLLFDGLDEIPSAGFKEFISRFNIFLQANQRTHIIASIRTNVFTREINKGIDQLAQLAEIYLGDITDRDVDNYLTTRVPDARSRKAFEVFARKNWVKAILHSPFYLNALTDLFIQDPNHLPSDKVDLIDRITQYKIAKDKEKFGTDLPVSKLLAFSNSLSLFLTLTGKNAIQETELSQFTDLPFDEIKRCSLFKIEEHGLWCTILFEHNNFQEYLSAKKLSKLLWSQLEPILFHIAGVHMLKPKMLNTVSYLFTILEADSDLFKSLFRKIRDTKISYLLQFERDKIAENVRQNVFKEIILKGKADETYYLNEDYRPENLTEFVNYSSESFNFLVGELELRGGVNHIYSVLDLIYSFKQSAVTIEGKKRLKKTITTLISGNGYPFAVYDRAIDVLTIYRMFDLKILKIIKKCPEIDHKMVRGAAIKYIDAGKFDDDFDYVLHSHRILTKSDYKVMAGLEMLYLTYIWEHLTESNGETVLNYFIENNEDIMDIAKTASYQDDHRPINRIYSRLSELFIASGSEVLVNAFIRFLTTIHYSSYKKDQWGNPAIFFEKLTDKARLFWLLLRHPQLDHLNHFLADLYSPEICDSIISGYQKSSISEKEVLSIRWSLGMRNNEARDELQRQLLANFGDKFKYHETVNWDEINAQRENRDLELMQSRDEFLNEARNLYDLIKEIKGDEAEEERLYELEFNEKKEIRQKVNNTLILRAISEYEIKGGFETFMSYFDQETWECYVYYLIEQKLVNGKKEALPKSLISFAEIRLKEKLLPHINFREAIKDTDEGSYTINSFAGSLINYYRAGALTLPESTQLDMLFLDHDSYARYPEKDDDLPRKLFEIIHASTDPERFKNRILLNIAEKKLSSRVITSNAFACREYQYEEALPALLDLLVRNTYPPRFKEELVKIITDLAKAPDIFDGIIAGWKKIHYPWQLVVLKHLAKFPIYKSRLISLIERSDLKPFIKDAEHFWKHDLITTGIRLGSLKSADFQFALFATKLKTFDHSTLKVTDFNRLITSQPDWVQAQAFRILDKCAPYMKDSSRNELVQFMEELIRSCAITSQTLFEEALVGYETLIDRYRVTNSHVMRLKSYERKLITDYYSEACSYESDDAAWLLINELNS